jgi:hypothetical protein
MRKGGKSTVVRPSPMRLVSTELGLCIALHVGQHRGRLWVERRRGYCFFCRIILSGLTHGLHPLTQTIPA